MNQIKKKIIMIVEEWNLPIILHGSEGQSI